MRLFDWFKEDVYGTFSQRLREVKERTVRKKLSNLADNILPALSTTLGIAFIPGLSTLITGLVGTTILPALGPFGLGILGVLAVPAILGGGCEAVLRIWTSFDRKHMFKANKACLKMWGQTLFAVMFSPLNFVYGFGRTAWNLATFRGYLGSVKATVHSIKQDMLRENFLSEVGAGSVIGTACPTIFDKLLVSPLVGLGAGCIAWYTVCFKREVSWSEKLLSFSYPFMGIYRGVLEGSHAAYDTYAYYSSGVVEVLPENTNQSIALRKPLIDDLGAKRKEPSVIEPLSGNALRWGVDIVTPASTEQVIQTLSMQTGISKGRTMCQLTMSYYPEEDPKKQPFVSLCNKYDVAHSLVAAKIAEIKPTTANKQEFFLKQAKNQIERAPIRTPLKGSKY